MMLRVLIVDDEPLARERLRRLIDEFADCEVAGEAGSGDEALRMVEEMAIDVVLLDIQMPGMGGLEAARHLDRMTAPPVVIFTTAYEGHALEAFDRGATDYLLKPVRRERLTAALARCRRRTPNAGDDTARSHISATHLGTLTRIPVDEVLYFQADQKYVTVRHRQGELLIEASLSSLEEEFGDRFVRLHRNALARRDALRSLVREEGRVLIQLNGCDESLEVSRRHLPEVRAILRD